MPTDGCCRRCGRDAEKLGGEFLCEDCRVHRPCFDRAASALRLEGEAREMVNSFKFRDHLWMRDDFVDWLEAVVRTRFLFSDIGVVAPMPSTFLHRVDRGYNPCDYLARALARRMGKPYDPRMLRRVGSPRRQGGLSEEERRRNVVGTFRCVRGFQSAAEGGETVLVVDDIMTTGSTLSECARELKRAGAARVWCVTLARSLRS